MLLSAATLARLAEAPLCFAHRCAVTLEGLIELTVRSGGGRGPCGWLRARCSERKCSAERVTSLRQMLLRVLCGVRV